LLSLACSVRRRHVTAPSLFAFALASLTAPFAVALDFLYQHPVHASRAWRVRVSLQKFASFLRHQVLQLLRDLAGMREKSLTRPDPDGQQHSPHPVHSVPRRQALHVELKPLDRVVIELLVRVVRLHLLTQQVERCELRVAQLLGPTHRERG
jgi:hypothetical protein